MRADGILVIDKPAGLTSRKTVGVIQELAGVEKAGHAGTLDPLATGVLIVCLGRATLLSGYLSRGKKSYQVRAELGRETDTYDIEGRVLREVPPSVTMEEVIEAAEEVARAGTQVPPPYSAVKYRGKPLYHYARKGIAITPEPRRVEIDSVEVVSLGGSDGSLQMELLVDCGPGTYVRSIVSDIGNLLGCGACVTGLRRVKSGSFSIDEAIGFDELVSLGREAALEAMVSIEDATGEMPSATVREEAVLAVKMGKRLEVGQLEKGEVPESGIEFRVLSPEGVLLAIYGPQRSADPDDTAGRAVRVIRPPERDKGGNETT